MMPDDGLRDFLTHMTGVCLINQQSNSMAGMQQALKTDAHSLQSVQHAVLLYNAGSSAPTGQV